MDREKLNSNFDINAKCEDMIKTSEMIVDKYQSIIDKGYEPSIYVSLAYDVKNYLPKLFKENQKLKKDFNKAVHKSTEFESKVYELETQQKEFIEYLKNEIKETSKKWGNVLTNKSLHDVAMTIRAYKEILSKYKEITGDKE